MREPTLDAEVFIVARTDAPQASVTYERITDGMQWVVSGECNRCGLCVIGAVGEWYVWDGPPGTPNANRDTRVPNRLDDPVMPGFVEDMAMMAQQTPTATVAGCSLGIEMLG